MSWAIRDATRGDLPAVVAIYNASIPGGWSTADTAPVTVAEREGWFAQFTPGRRPLWVADGAGEVIGWVGLSSFYAGRPAYAATAEVSFYVAPAHQRRGLGTALLEHAVAACPRLGVSTLLSMHFDHNGPTRKVNARLGFEPLGHLTDIATVGGVSRGLVISALRIVPRPTQAG